MNENKKDKKWFFPPGIVLNLYKYYVRPVEQYDKAEEFFDNPPDGKSRTLITFGNFDRICFAPVPGFEDYWMAVCNERPWLGNRQSVMLYSVTPEEDRRYCFQSDSNGEFREDVFGVREGDDFHSIEDIRSTLKRRFLMVTFLYVSGAAKASVSDYTRFLKYCRTGISAVADAYNRLEDKPRLGYEVFGTFNSAEVAILWDSDSFADVMYLVDNLRHMVLSGFEREPARQKMFISSYTFVALTSADREQDGDVRGGLLIQLAGRTDICEDGEGETSYQAIGNYLDSVKASWKKDGEGNPSTMYSVGEYDIMQPSGGRYLSAFCPQSKEAGKKRGPKDASDFDIHNKDYCTRFLESTTRLYYLQEDVKELAEKMEGLWLTKEGGGLLRVSVEEEDKRRAGFSLEHLDVLENFREQSGEEIASKPNVRSKFMRLKEQLEKLLPYSTSFLRTLQLLYIDYVQCVTTAGNHLWVKDFDAQFEAVLDVLESAPGFANRGPSPGAVTTRQAFLEIGQKMLRSLQQQICHISDAGKLFFEEPRSHFSYTGQWDLLMHTYYGVLKCLLEEVYRADRAQSPLYPLINFEPVSHLSSEMYYDENVDGKADTCKRFIAITLPYSAWESLWHYIPMLVHELYHYVAPYDRVSRNYYMGCILCTQVFCEAAKALLKLCVPDRNDNTEWEAAKKVANFISNKTRERLAAYFSECLHPNREPDPTLPLAGDQEEKDLYVNRLLNCLLDKDSTLRQKISGVYQESLKQAMEDQVWTKLSKSRTKEESRAVDIMLHAYRDNISLFGQISPPADEDNPSKQLDLYLRWSNCLQTMREGIAAGLRPLFESLSELFPDAAMLRVTGMHADSYLVLFAVHLNNRAIEPKALNRQAMLRLGIILDWLQDWPAQLPGPSPLAAYQQSFKTMYLRFYQLHGKGRENLAVLWEDWFEAFEESYRAYRSTYSFYHCWLRPMIEESFLPCLAEKYEDERVRTLRRLCGEYYEMLKGAADEEGATEALFSLSIQTIQSFQIQHELRVICSQPPKAGGRAPVPARMRIPTRIPAAYRKVYNLWHPEQLNKQLLAMYEDLSEHHRKAFPEDNNFRFWYRGTKNIKYDILPSIMVHFLHDKNMPPASFSGRNHVGTLREYQHNLLERFKYRADGAPEQLRTGEYAAEEYLALMQHYSQYTNFLDWSEDAFTSLYFALEAYVDGDEKGKKEQRNDIAGFYMFDPMLYNRARRMLIQSKTDCCNCEERANCRNCCDKVTDAFNILYLDTCSGGLGHIPNVSLPDERARHWMFLDGACPDRKVSTRINSELLCQVKSPAGETSFLKESELDMEFRHLPIAFYSSRLNPRVRAQSGQFVAYDLDTKPTWNPDWDSSYKSTDLFRYMALNQIQDTFLQRFPDEHPFLLQLSLHTNVKGVLGQELSCLGINRYRIYPELEHLK